MKIKYMCVCGKDFDTVRELRIHCEGFPVFLSHYPQRDTSPTPVPQISDVKEF